MSKISEERLLRQIYSEVINNFSIAVYQNQNIYIKHFNNLDQLDTDYFYTQYYNIATKRGFPTEQERLDILKKDKLWGEDQDKELDLIKESIKNLHSLKRKSFRLSDFKSINSQIEEQEKSFMGKMTKKINLIGSTAETFTKKKVDAFLISKSFFKDRGLTSLLFSEDEFDNLNIEEVNEVYDIYYNTTNNLSEKNIKKIAVAEFFLNVFQLAENIHQFLGKPLCQLTFYQIQLCAYGNFYKTIMANDPKPPEEVAGDPDKLEDWYFGQSNAKEALQKVSKEGEAGTLVGLSSEDRKFLGMDARPPSMRDKIVSSGGEMNMQEIMKLEGV